MSISDIFPKSIVQKIPNFSFSLLVLLLITVDQAFASPSDQQVSIVVRLAVSPASKHRHSPRRCTSKQASRVFKEREAEMKLEKA
ncbi:hypothetical protein HRI_003217700 [Hibiscus trionum]|uniref:Secreted protein n=1 Tax=Hibiscus trionum TaxID=183268 RepID=A0A9W7IG69_HIBTR|nr:hypothetical protein HRI_003217700 [Hibiscus trionum]